jgi:integrase
MATIRKLSSGKWNVQIRKKGHLPVSKSFTTKSDAEKWLRWTESEIERGVFVDRSEAESTTLAEALNRYLKEVTPNKKGAAQEEQRILKWLQHPYSKRSLASLKASDFASYRDKRLNEVSPATVRLELAILSHLFNVARMEWCIEGISNPLNGIRKPKPSNARCRRLSHEELNHLLAACKQARNPCLYGLVTLAIETGMRLGEMISLTWDQVDISNRAVMLYDTKNGEDRVVPLSSRAALALMAISRTLDNDRVFYAWTRSDSIKKSWHTALRLAWIEDFHFHDLRHEATSRFFEIGLNAMEVASITGHKSMQMLKRYTHPRVSELADKLEAHSQSFKSL